MRRLIPLVVAVLGLVAAPLQAVAAPPKPVPSDARIAHQAPDLGPSPCALPVTGAAVNPRLTSLFTAHGGPLNPSGRRVESRGTWPVVDGANGAAMTLGPLEIKTMLLRAEVLG